MNDINHDANRVWSWNWFLSQREFEAEIRSSTILDVFCLKQETFVRAVRERGGGAEMGRAEISARSNSKDTIKIYLTVQSGLIKSWNGALQTIC